MKFKRFFWWMAGGRSEILERCPVDAPSWTASGICVMLVVVLAIVSGFIFGAESLNFGTGESVLVGILIGALVFATDRKILTDSPKEAADAARPWFTSGVFWTAIYRLIFAAVISLAIGHSLVMHALKGSIDAALAKQREITRQETIETDPSKAKIDKLRKEINDLEGKITPFEQARDRLKIAVKNELAGIKTADTSDKIGRGIRYRTQQEALDMAEKDLAKIHEEVDSTLQATRTQLEGLEHELSDRVAARDGIEARAQDLRGRSRALFSLILSDPGSFFGVSLLTLLPFLFDTFPVLQRLLGGMTTYDRMLHLQRRRDDLAIRKQELYLATADAIFDRVYAGAGTGGTDLPNEAETDTARQIHIAILNRAEEDLGQETLSGRQGDRLAHVEFENANGEAGPVARVFIPPDLEGSVRLADLEPQIRTFEAEVSSDAGQKLAMAHASNSAGVEIDATSRPLIQQLSPDDRRVVMTFGPATESP